MRFRTLLLVLAVAAAIGGAGYAYVLNTRVAGPLTGEPVGRDIAGRRPVAVTIDNLTPGARPQSGLDDASLVFETLAEGGITRFMAVYLERDAPMVGPVRSTRLYFNSWAAGLGAIFGHDGGNVDALQELKTLPTVFNVDSGQAAGPFWRISTRLAPHNEYTSTARLRQYAAARGGSGGSRMTIPHKADAPFFSRPVAFTLDIGFSSSDYAVEWRYDRGPNDYRRFMGGEPHVEPATGRQLTAKNVVVMVTAMSPDYDPYTPGAIKLGTEGSGKATVYEDGKSIPATWSKPSVTAPLRWLDAHGNPIPLNRGSTWVEVVPLETSVTTSTG